MLLIGALVVLAQAAGADARADGAEASAVTRTRRPECVAVLVTSPQQPATSRQHGPFSATRILDVRFGTVLRRQLVGPHLLELKVQTPRGHLYQTLTVPFTAAGQSRGERHVDGYPRPMREQETRAVSQEGARGYEVSATLPVGGTAIMSNSLYGEWRVQPFLDGALCGQAASFEIRP
jgi:hypothetical protein